MYRPSAFICDSVPLPTICGFKISRLAMVVTWLKIVLVRGFNYETSRRMERMLNTRMSVVAKMFGDKVISDMAIIGRDMYMKEGASWAFCSLP